MPKRKANKKRNKKITESNDKNRSLEKINDNEINYINKENSKINDNSENRKILSKEKISFIDNIPSDENLDEILKEINNEILSDDMIEFKDKNFKSKFKNECIEAINNS